MTTINLPELESLTTEQLKVFAFDLITFINQSQVKLQEVTALINKRNNATPPVLAKEPPKEEPKQ